MSYIDTINHSFLGLLGGIPVYHPLENDREYNLTPKSIAIGGGSGEHSIFVINDINDCVKFYIFYYFEQPEYDYYTDTVIHKSYWSIEDGYHFFKSVKADMKKLDINSAEKYITLAVAEYLLSHGEHLINPLLIEKARSLSNVPNISAIKQVPDGEPPFGKIIIDGKVKWGYTFDDEIANLNFNEDKI